MTVSGRPPGPSQHPLLRSAVCRPSGRGSRGRSRPLAQPVSAHPVTAPCRGRCGPWLQGPPPGPFPEAPAPWLSCPPWRGGREPGGRDGAGLRPSASAPASAQPTGAGGGRCRSTDPAMLFPTPGSPRPEVRPGSPSLVCRRGSRGPEGSPSPSREVSAHLRTQDVPQPGLTFSSHVSCVPGRGKGASGLGGCTQGAGLPRESLEMPEKLAWRGRGGAVGPASPWPRGAAALGAGREGSLLGFHVGGQGMRRRKGGTAAPSARQ